MDSESNTATTPAPPRQPQTPEAIDSLPLATVDALLNFSEAITRTTRPDDILAEIVGTAVAMAAVPWGVLLLPDPAGDSMLVAMTHGVERSDLPPTIQMDTTSVPYQSFMRGGAILLEGEQARQSRNPVMRALQERLGIGTILSVPLRAGEEWLGSLHLAGPNPRHFNPPEIAALERLGRLAAQVLLHSRALSAAAGRVGALETMQAVATRLEATLDLDTVLTILVERAVELTGASGGGLFLWDEATERLTIRKGVNTTPQMPTGMAAGEGLTGQVFSTRRPQVHNSYLHYANAIPAGAATGMTNALSIPLLRHGQAFGVLSVFSQLFKPFTSQDADLLTLFGSQVTVALDNQALYATVLRQQQQLDSIINALHDALVVYDRELRVVLINPAAIEILGISVAVIGKERTEILLHPQDYTRYRLERLHDWQNTVETVLHKGVTLAGMTLVHSDPVRTIESFYSPFRDETGAVVGVIALARDVSGTQELERLRAELEVARRQDDFISIAAHELRTPVTAIKGFTDLLARRVKPGYVTNERDSQMLGSLLAQIGRLSTLVNDLLDVGRLGADQINFNWEVCLLDVVVQAALDSVRPVAGPRESDLRPVSGVPALVRCDRARLEQVFINLLTNALKYAPSGPITTTISLQDGWVRVDVRDQGAGIAPEDSPHLFERFYRAHDVYAHQRGLGLGLYISQGIIERHGGRIGVESALGQGSVFYVELPVVSAEESTQ